MAIRAVRVIADLFSNLTYLTSDRDAFLKQYNREGHMCGKIYIHTVIIVNSNPF